MRPSAHRTAHVAMLLLVSLAAVVNFFFGEKVVAGGGLGWDGVMYGRLVTSLPDMVRAGELNTYYAQRILPAAVVRAALQMAGLPFSTPNIIKAFEIYNYLLLMAACLLWKGIADACNLKLTGRWIGFAGLFVNFQASKQTFFYPVLTDTTALVASLALLFFYLTGRRRALVTTSLIGAFAWPTISLTGALLALSKPSDLRIEPATRTHPASQDPARSYLVLLAFAVGGLALLAVFAGAVRDVCSVAVSLVWEGVPDALRPAAERLLEFTDPCDPFRGWLTALPTLAGVALLLVTLLRGSLAGGWAAARERLRCDPVSVCTAIAILLVPAILVRVMGNPARANPSGLLPLLALTLRPQEGQILVPLVSAISFWGPTVLIILLWWRAFCEHAARLGVGVQATVAVVLLLAMAGEPRFVTSGWPFLVLGAALTVERVKPGARFAVAFAVLTVLLAQFWLPLNVLPWTGGDYERLTEFPKQLYFLHYGVWMGWPAYLAQAAAFAAGAVWLWKSLPQFRTAAVVSEPRDQLPVHP